MTPAESHEVTSSVALSVSLSASLSVSREQLARALARLERLTYDAIETISHERLSHRQEKQQLEKRLADLTQLVEQERSNFEQRASLLTSVASETEERAKASTELTARLNESERLLAEHLEVIARLESDLENRSMQLREQEALESASKREIEEWTGKVSQLEARVADVAKERDDLKGLFYEREREDAQYVLRLTREDRERAAKAVDTLIDQLSFLETRITITQ